MQFAWGIYPPIYALEPESSLSNQAAAALQADGYHVFSLDMLFSFESDLLPTGDYEIAFATANSGIVTDQCRNCT